MIELSAIVALLGLLLASAARSSLAQSALAAGGGFATTMLTGLVVVRRFVSRR
ncbi:hypothetical protein [Nocardia arizonensis]|uniref:hypothetical protein n=1 Tax=Nocardia arizonensis TaxID=1141647 RepID=UPI0012E1DBDE|nr:hypothetical protein [Nocardia arizonensis]